MNNQRLYIGTSNIVLPVPNKQSFPPAFIDKSRLAFYASIFNSLEVNSSFYKIPMPATTARWAAEVPRQFRFSFKLLKDITHSKTSVPDEKLIKQFMQVIDQVGEKKGSLLIQLPAGAPFDLSRFEDLLAGVHQYNQNQQWAVNVELRHEQWYIGETHELLREYQAGLVVHDMKGAPADFKDWTGTVYLRFHGPESRYRGSYTSAFLASQATQIRTWLDHGKTVYVYFNNTLGDAFGNVTTLKGLLASA